MMQAAPSLFPAPSLPPFAQLEYKLLTPAVLSSALMSHSHPTASSTTSFQLIIDNALKAYEKPTRKDLLAHPLAVQLQACNSLSAILAVFQQQVQVKDQSRSDVRWTKWLYPTVDVLFTLSATLAAGVGLVCLGTCSYLVSAFSYHFFGRHSRPRMQYLLQSAYSFRCVFSIACGGTL